VLDPDRPRAAADRDVAACVHKAGAGEREQLGSPLGGIALADAAEVEVHARVEIDAARPQPDASRRRRRRSRFPLRRQLFEAAVVPGRDERVVHGGVEAAARTFACLEREPDDADEIRPGLDPAVAVQPRELRVVAEARQERFEPVELELRSVERAVCAVRIDEELDLRAHRVERAPVDHEVLVIVNGGSVTILTGAGAAAAEASCRLCVTRASCARCATI